MSVQSGYRIILIAALIVFVTAAAFISILMYPNLLRLAQISIKQTTATSATTSTTQSSTNSITQTNTPTTATGTTNTQSTSLSAMTASTTQTPCDTIDRVGSATTPFANGDFENGNLQPWYGANACATSDVAHGGSYSAKLVAPNDQVTGNMFAIMQEDFQPIPLPVRFTAYFYNDQYPSICRHPYTQWAIYDTSSHVNEATFANYNGLGQLNAVGMVDVVSEQYFSQPTNPYPANQWVQLSVDLYSDHFIFYINGAQTYASTNSYVFSAVKSVQFIASCGAIVHIDDVTFSPVATPMGTASGIAVPITVAAESDREDVRKPN